MRAKVLKTLGILCAGAGAGAAVALLYAPQSGRRTRRDLQLFGHRKLNQMRHLQDDVASYLADRVSDVRRGSRRIPSRFWSRAS
jgi:gas vesicle protein